ncbi:MAG: L-threonylcarbamoyladenylate synthase [Sedimentisphaerales bacterium]
METIIYKIIDPAKDAEKFKQVADCIDVGGLAVIATETVYGIACKVDADSLAKLDAVKERPAEKRYTVHLGDKNKIKNYVPHIWPTAKKLIEKALPGPLTLVFELDAEQISVAKSNFDSKTASLLYADNSIGIRCPDQKVCQAILNLCKYQVVMPSANISGKEPAINAEQAIEQLSGKVDIIVDSGQCKLKQSSTVVKISPTETKILRQGGVSAEQIRRFSVINIIFVCTGNTCRSPMAEALAKKAIAEKLKCRVDQLGDIGYKVASAGVAAINGIAASPESVRFCDAKGASLAEHRSQRLTAKMVESADYIFAMSRGHLDAIMDINPAAAAKCRLLNGNADVADPIGRGDEIYTICGNTIEKAVNNRISELFK